MPPRSPSPSTTDYLLYPGAKGTSGPMVLQPLTSSQVTLRPILTTSGGSATTLIRHTGLSVCAFRRQQSRYNLVLLLFVPFLTASSPPVEAVVGRVSSITRLYAEKRADLKAFFLPDGLAPSHNGIKDFLSISHYSDHYLVSRCYHITKTMWFSIG